MGSVSYFMPPNSLDSLLQEDPHSYSAPPSTKLMCTIGPVSNDVETLKELLRAGMSVRGDVRHKRGGIAWVGGVIEG
jgi:hypothetical protein